jgi:beta-lactamase class A
MLLRTLGGPAGLTSYARTIGDLTTRLDRIETELNEATPGDVRDTTSPRAMLANLHSLVIGDALKPASREQLVAWLKANKTGNERMRAKLPPGWIVGDKTGLGNHGTINDVGIIWPPDGAPILLAIYLTNSDKPIAQRAAILQEIGRLTAAGAR